MSLFSRLLGRNKSGETADQTVSYKDYRILANPAREGTKYRIGAIIEKEADGDDRKHHLIRADLLETRDVAVEVSVAKAKQVIDEQGDALFD